MQYRRSWATRPRGRAALTLTVLGGGGLSQPPADFVDPKRGTLMLLKGKKWYARAGLLLAPLLLAGGIIAPLTQQAGAAGGTDVNNAGLFKLNGLVKTATVPTTTPTTSPPPYDWASLFNTKGSAKSGVQDLINSKFIADPSSTDFAITQNTKDTANITTWTCKVTSVTPKDELQNAYAAAFLAPTGSPVAGHRLLYMALERGSVTGSSNAGFWLFKKRVICDTNAATVNFGHFIVAGSNPVKMATHTTGDLFLFASFTSGGTAVTVSSYKWNAACNGSKSQPKGCISSSSTGGLTKSTAVGHNCRLTNKTLCGIANATAPIKTPWAPGTVGTNGFFEAGVDVTNVLKVKTLVATTDCFSSFFADTRASGSSVGNEGHDFAVGNFSLCKTTRLTTTATPKTGVVGSLKPSDRATLRTLTGSVKTETITFILYSGAGCSGTIVFTKTVKLNATGVATVSDTTALTKTGTYHWFASYGGDQKTGGLNGTSKSGCTTEPVVVNPASATITTAASGSITVPGTVHDTAKVSGGHTPSGTITFKLFSTTKCAVQYGTAVTKAFTGDGTFTSPTIKITKAGTYYWRASATGNSTNNAIATTACKAATETVVVNKANPTLTTQASSAVIVPGTVHDSAKVSGGHTPSGTITFKLFSTTKCAVQYGTAVTKAFTGDGTFTSPTIKVTKAGFYYWRASATGNTTNNAIATSPCATATETVTVGKASPTLSTKASGSVTVPGTVHDTAKVSGGHTPSGTITFKLFSTTKCAVQYGTAVTKVFSGDGTFTSPTIKVTKAGTYYWRASATGNGTNNAIATTPCKAATETVTVKKAGPTLATTASGSVTVPGTVHDTAKVSGGHTPSGTITFKLFSTTKCAVQYGTAVTKPFTGDGTFTSPIIKVTKAGTYYWRASATGNTTNNAIATSPCATANETVIVKKANPTITTKASGPVIVPGTVHDTAKVSGGHTASGTITFKLFSTTKCVAQYGNAVTKTFTGDGTFTSPPIHVTTVGKFYWRASATGNTTNNAIATTSCGAPTETVTVEKATPTLKTIMFLGDIANVAKGDKPTGTINFTLYSGASCTLGSGTAVFTKTVPLSGGAANTLGALATTLSKVELTAGLTYSWRVTYKGDSFNNSVSTCTESTGQIT